SENASHHIDVEGDNFVLDGHRLHIISGSLHYFRVPSAYWQWSHHEPEERQYRFEGDHDVAEFVKIAAEEGLYVLLRPGPYICAERDLGGFPYWLLSKYPDIELRTTDQDFTEETNIWMNKLFEQLELLLFGNGGPIILVQIENEYGSYGNDMSYQIQQRNMIFKHVSTNAILYTTDASAENHFSKGAIPGTLTTIDFMAQINVESKFCPLRHFMPSGPLMNSEFYTGWLTHWGEDMANIPEEKVVKTLEDMLNYHIHINFYVFFGGTNFGFTAAKYYEIRNTLLKVSTVHFIPAFIYCLHIRYYFQYNFGDRNYDLPQPSPKGAYGTITVSPKMSLLSPEGKASLGKKYKDVHAVTLPTFEALKQRGGFVLYETILKQKGGLLEIRQPRDLIFVFVDGMLQGKISRMHKVFSLALTAKKGSILSLLGYIWINGHNLGRYWPTMGPQVTLYVPGVWLNPPPKKNLIQILELNKSPKDLAMKFRDYPILERRGIGHKWVHQ
ncbi:Beta-galactosidase, partial [Operophtera brumata]